MTLIILVNIIAILAASVLFFLAKAGIKHYLDLYQNEDDTKKLNILAISALIITILCILLSCTLIINETGYNTKNNMEVNHGIQR
jgi:mannose/fructose/N-acetylgalactosamine-specific phosphotransferase system component IIC